MTQIKFDQKALTKVLNAEHADIINKVKEVISRPEFAYEDTHDIPNFRETVFHLRVSGTIYRYEWRRLL